MRQTRQKQTSDLTKILIATIAALAVILVAVICIAVNTHNNGGQAGNGTGNNSSQDQPPAGNDIYLDVKPVEDLESITILEKITFAGVSDVTQSLTVNGTEVSRNDDGSFTCEVPLAVGKNEIVFSHKGEQMSFQVERRFALKSFSPSGDQTYGSGAIIRFEVIARAESTVTAKLGENVITLTATDSQPNTELPEGFVLYKGEHKLSANNTTDLDLGVITYTCVNGEVTETFASGKIICQKASSVITSNPSVTPSYGDYIDVGSGYVVEIVANTAETFDGDTLDDWSHPTNNYLPKGTLDYCSKDLIVRGSQKYVQMRCGRRVYWDKKNRPMATRVQVAQCYAMTLPDHNEIGFVSMESVGNHTVLILDTLWKAPFLFDILPQEYSNPNGGSGRDYQITEFTATHIDITLCYTTVFNGTVQIPEGNPIFKSAELIKNEKDCVLRLHLKETGEFYGWDCYYNEAGQLCFEFLNPAKVTETDSNDYGVDLSDVTVMLDVGHGGHDGGAVGNLGGVQIAEAERNLHLAMAIRDELVKMGATVLFNREDDTTLKEIDRIQIVKNAKPDLCIAVHHNALDLQYAYHNGFETMYYTPFSKLATEHILAETKESGVYESAEMRWFNYYVARHTMCPVVLTENGYLSNEFDLTNIADTAANQKKAAAIAKGVANYFLELNK